MPSRVADCQCFARVQQSDHPSEKCAPKCVRSHSSPVLVAFYHNRFSACVAEQQKRLTVDQESSDYRGYKSYRMH
jgi:hypothetical protein